MNELGLGYNVIVVGQDLGGIVGMSVVKDGPEKFSGLVLINSGLPTGFSVDDLIKENPLEVVRTNLPFFVLRATIALFGTSLPIVSPTTINYILYFFHFARFHCFWGQSRTNSKFHMYQTCFTTLCLT